MQTSWTIQATQFKKTNKNRAWSSAHSVSTYLYCKLEVGIKIAVLLVKNLGSARSVMMRMTRPRTMSELSSFPAVTKRKLIEWNTETNKRKNR